MIAEAILLSRKKEVLGMKKSTWIWIGIGIVALYIWQNGGVSNTVNAQGNAALTALQTQAAAGTEAIGVSSLQIAQQLQPEPIA
jgi:hypothetical protein